jgi:hypothetical protein
MARKFSTGLRNAILGSNSFKAALADGVIGIYSGGQPADADQAETGTLLCLVTESGGAFVPGAAANGLEFGTAANGIIEKAAAETWMGTILATGSAGWFRHYDNNYTTGASTTAVRFDGSCATSGAQLNLSTLNFVLNAPFYINTYEVELEV